jgi:ABC-type branched-subunit amino acid transport system ATPase component
VIEVDHLVKRFGGVTAVDGLTFTVRPGHVTGFLGPNGAGKTTTMRVILGRTAQAHLTSLARATASAAVGLPSCCSSPAWRRSQAGGSRVSPSA